MDFEMRILSAAEIESIERQALKILDEVGLRLYNDGLCRYLSSRGVPVVGDTVHLPGELVSWALAVAPREIALHGRDGRASPLRPGRSLLLMGSGATKVLDYAAAQLRPFATDDVVRFARLSQAMDEIDLGGGGGQPQDVAPELEVLTTVQNLVLNNNKHHLAGPHDLATARTWRELVEIAGAGLDMRAKPTVSFVVSTTSPLQMDYDSSEVLQYAAQRSVPFLASSCPMAGGTSPLALIGTMVLLAAEDLFLLTLAQLVHEGAPVIWGGAPGILDLRSGSLSYGAAERHLLMGANIELAEHFGLPYYVPSGSVDSWRTDVHVGAEKMQCWMARWAKNTVFGIAAGSLYNGLAASLEQAVIDVDLWQQAGRIFDGLDMARLEESFEVIRRVGPGGSFLEDSQTLRLMRSGEIFYSKLANREGEQGADMLTRAHEEVERLLASPPYTPPDAVLQEIDRYVRARRGELMAG